MRLEMANAGLQTAIRACSLSSEELARCQHLQQELEHKSAKVQVRLKPWPAWRPHTPLCHVRLPAV